MATTRFKGETAGERLDLSGISDSDMIQLRHKPGTIDDADKGISKAQLLSCPFGVSDTAAATAAKAADLTDSNPDFTLVSGREVVVCFTTANTASNPTLNFAGSGAIPLYLSNGAPVGAWNAGAWMHLKYFYATVGNSQIQRWILMSQEINNEVIMAASATITGKTIVSGSTIKIMFTADLSGSDTTTALSLIYNGTSYNVKVGKNGSLSNFTASEVSSGVYKYLQAYTTLELAFDGTQFIIAGNPLVLSGSGYEIYADGMGKVNEVAADNMNSVTSNAVVKSFEITTVYNPNNRIIVVKPKDIELFVFTFYGCTITEMAGAISTLGISTQNLQVCFVSRRTSANTDVHPCTVILSTNGTLAAWYESGGVEYTLGTNDKIFGQMIVYKN